MEDFCSGPTTVLSPLHYLVGCKSSEDQGFNSLHPLHTLIVFDWDDTLMPSSWITACGHLLEGPLNIDAKTFEELRILEQAVIALLTSASRHGDVLIITNAETGWVELSCNRFLPSATHVINQTRIVSARSTYESQYPNSPLHWKYAAFSREIQNYLDNRSPDHQKNVMSFGDSFHERDALHYVTNSMKNVHTKSVKFVDRPSVEQLRQQVEMIHCYLTRICNYRNSLDVSLSLSCINQDAAVMLSWPIDAAKFLEDKSLFTDSDDMDEDFSVDRTIL